MKANLWSNLWRIGLGCALLLSYSLWGKAAIQLLFALTQGFDVSPEGN